MENEQLGLSYWLAQTAASGPMLVMLVSGLVICNRQRTKRPRAARLLGWAMAAQLIWLTVGSPAFYMTMNMLGFTNGFRVDEVNDFGWIIRSIAITLPSSIIYATIWGTALWAVLQVDDWNLKEDDFESEA